MATKKKGGGTQNVSAKTGRFVTEAAVKRSPATTYTRTKSKPKSKR